MQTCKAGYHTAESHFALPNVETQIASFKMLSHRARQHANAGDTRQHVLHIHEPTSVLKIWIGHCDWLAHEYAIRIDTPTCAMEKHLKRMPQNTTKSCNVAAQRKTDDAQSILSINICECGLVTQENWRMK